MQPETPKTETATIDYLSRRREGRHRASGSLAAGDVSVLCPDGQPISAADLRQTLADEPDLRVLRRRRLG